MASIGVQNNGTPFDRFARAATPIAAAAILIFLSNLPLFPSVGVPSAPNVALITIFFWRMAAPRTMPYGAIFLLGFLSDGLSGAPLGLSSFSLLAASFVITLLRRGIRLVPAAFWYLGFVLALLVAEFTGWTSASFYYGRLVAPDALGVRLAMSALLYLPIAFAMSLIDTFIVSPEGPSPKRRGKGRNPTGHRPRTIEPGKAREVRRRN